MKPGNGFILGILSDQRQKINVSEIYIVLHKILKFNFMKRQITFIIALLIFSAFGANAQTKQVYSTSGGELIFSFADINNQGDETGNIMRFSPFFNLQTNINYDVNNSFGLYTGLAIRNVGFIYDVPNSSTRMKYRNYTLGIPVGIKVGKMDGAFVYGGYEIEFPLNYKEKTFENEVREDKFNVWFSDRCPAFYNTVFLGVNLPYGANLKFKYYLTSFHNKDFEETKDGVTTKPYEFLESNVFYFALSFDLFKNNQLVDPTEKNDNKSAALY